MSDAFERDNIELWDFWAPLHVESPFYDLESFVAGEDRIHEFELEEVGDVTGKKLLHLQCHIGLDTIGWARRGASVVGVDFSGTSIDVARQIAQRVGVGSRASFVCASVADAGALVDDDFDIVYTSWGTYDWLPDLSAWAATIVGALKPGGFFYMADLHPIAHVFETHDGHLVAEYPYGGGGRVTYDARSYADRNTPAKTAHAYSHSLGELLGALGGAGLELEFLRERDWLPWQHFTDMVAAEPYGYQLAKTSIPLSFSLRAHKP